MRSIYIRVALWDRFPPRSGQIVVSMACVSSPSQKRPTVLCLFTNEVRKVIQSSPIFHSNLYRIVSIPNELDACRIAGRFDYLKATQLCFKAVEEHKVDFALALDNDSAPILPSLVAKYGKSTFRGPSFESFYLTFNKFYTRKFLDPNPIPFAHIDLNRPLKTTELDNFVTQVGFPAIFKPQTATASMLVHSLNSVTELSEAIEYSRDHYNSALEITTPLISEHLDVAKYPLAFTDGMILEKYIDGEMFDLDG